ncbi:MAG TPA: hypothetical protein VK631_18345 [Solirubrobacteraceae bacterium]|nr:hypothetical protein [Solirubrobacteraceae bacterium]
MQRKFTFLGERTEDGFITHNRDEVREALLDLESAVQQLGGIVTMTSIREQVGPDQFVTTGVLMSYDSFTPARAQTEIEEPVES